MGTLPVECQTGQYEEFVAEHQEVPRQRLLVLPDQRLRRNEPENLDTSLLLTGTGVRFGWGEVDGGRRVRRGGSGVMSPVDEVLDLPKRVPNQVLGVWKLVVEEVVVKLYDGTHSIISS